MRKSPDCGRKLELEERTNPRRVAETTYEHQEGPRQKWSFSLGQDISKCPFGRRSACQWTFLLLEYNVKVPECSQKASFQPLSIDNQENTFEKREEREGKKTNKQNYHQLEYTTVKQHDQSWGNCEGGLRGWSIAKTRSWSPWGFTNETSPKAAPPYRFFSA